jgi:hypothetical protein
MFFPESEAIAREHVELGDVVRRVDDQLSRLSTTAPLRPEDFAAVLGFDEFQVTSVFRLLEEKRLLGTETMGECPNCQNLLPVSTMRSAWNDGDSFVCSACLQVVPQRIREVRVYRLNQIALDRNKAVRNAVISHENDANEEPLNFREQQVLITMLKLDAVDSDRHKKAEIIAKEGLLGDLGSIKSVMSGLAKLKFVKTKKGPGGGNYLTAKGHSRAVKLKAINSNS